MGLDGDGSGDADGVGTALVEGEGGRGGVRRAGVVVVLGVALCTAAEHAVTAIPASPITMTRRATLPTPSLLITFLGLHARFAHQLGATPGLNACSPSGSTHAGAGNACVSSSTPAPLR